MAKENIFRVFVDTSYLTHMPSDEAADWNRLLRHAKECVINLDMTPKLEIHISDVALREYQGKLRDELIDKIEKVKSALKNLEREHGANNLAKRLKFESVIFPTTQEIDLESNNLILEMLSSGINKMPIEMHHAAEVWDKYFSWSPPFNVPPDTSKIDKPIREKRRTHIPDAWILEAAIDKRANGQIMLCLCKDENLFSALEYYGHIAHKSAKDIYEILFSSEKSHSNSNDYPPITKSENTSVKDNLLDDLLNKSLSPSMYEISLRLLGYLPALEVPSHTSLINQIAKRGYDPELIRAYARILSDTDNEYIKNTGTHFIVGNMEICAQASERVQDEIIAMLDEE
jgi:PIN domain